VNSRSLAILCSTFLLSACQAYSLVEPGSRNEFGGFYSVSPDIAWSRAEQGELEVWTVDGPALEAVRFTNGLEDGEPLFDTPRASDSQEPVVFRAFMSEPDIMTLVADSLSRLGAGQLETRDLEPTRFGDRAGFRFSLSFLTERGLAMQGTAVGTIADEKLFLILYSAASSYYYAKYEPHVEQLIDSLQISPEL